MWGIGNMVKTERKSNFELMRIISMLFIVIYHVILHSGLFDTTTKTAYMLIMFLNALILVHVNSFAILSGYFQSSSKFRLSKIISINALTWFYKSLFLIIFILLSKYTVYKVEISMIDTIETLLPIDFGTYWFVNCYMVTYILSPFLNKLIEQLNQHQLKKLIYIMILLFCIIPVLTIERFIYTTNGRSLFTFILLYFVGAYLRKYPVENNYLFKKYTRTAKKHIFIILYLICATFNFLIAIVGKDLSNYGTMASQVGKIMSVSATNFLSPILILQSIFYFLIFTQIDLKSKFVNGIAKSTFGVYLIHENYYIRNNLYNYLGITIANNPSSKIIIVVLTLSICLFVISVIIDKIRSLFSKLIMKSKIMIKFITYVKIKCTALGLNINW